MLSEAYIKEEGKLYRMTKRELVEYAKANGIKPYAKSTKEQIKWSILRKKGLV